MKRRQFIALIGSMSTWPLTVLSQQPALSVIGFLSGSSGHNLDAFHAGLKLTGFVEGQNVAIVYRWAQGQYDQLPGLAADLVDRQVAVIVATSYPAALAAKTTSTTTPVVFVSGADPVQGGLVTSLNRPTGNLTGINVFHGELGAKRLELLRELVPTASVIGYLLNPKNPNSEVHSAEVQAAARAMTQQILLFKASSESEIDAAFVAFAQGGVGALLIGDDPFFGSRRDQLVALAAQRTLPTMYFYRQFAIGGGLISYAMNLEDQWRQTGIYTGRVLKGEKPADLPVLQPTKLELVINMRTANSLRLIIPATLLARADEVIE